MLFPTIYISYPNAVFKNRWEITSITYTVITSISPSRLRVHGVDIWFSNIMECFQVIDRIWTWNLQHNRQFLHVSFRLIALSDTSASLFSLSAHISSGMSRKIWLHTRYYKGKYVTKNKSVSQAIYSPPQSIIAAC